MTKRMKERQEPANESRDFDCLFHSLRVEEGSFDEIMKHLEVPFRVVLRQHNL